ncbi:Uncharacterised protein [Vibrio cholerae]|uniref:Uncharacterized protein n=1 Tax=Vibrio cholerae TaxID=666 RepID=A0A655V2J0_VIBCL|nr:Uncharacterised protein [Vibrio cholerae]
MLTTGIHRIKRHLLIGGPLRQQLNKLPCAKFISQQIGRQISNSPSCHGSIAYRLRQIDRVVSGHFNGLIVSISAE